MASMKLMAPKVLVFDSGLGGLGVMAAVKAAHPGCQLVYCTDNAAFPYGIKPEPQLIDRVSRVLASLDKTVKPDIFVIACNTASTVALPRVRSLIAAPVVGVVPAIKPAAQIAKTPNIGLLATPGTIQRSYTLQLIDQFGQGFSWVKIGSSELVLVAEQKMYGEPVDTYAIKHAVKAFKTHSADMLDTIVLACTHFPLIKQELAVELPQIKNWVDSSEAIARRVGFWLHELGYTSLPADTNPEHEIILTADAVDSDKLARLCTIHGFGKHRILAIE